MRESAEVRQRWYVWHGDVAALEAIAEVFRSVASEGLKREVEKIDADYYSRPGAEERWSATLSVSEREFNFQLEGAPEDVLDRIDTRRATTIAFAAGARYRQEDGCRLALSRWSGVLLQVNGSKDWVQFAAPRVRDEVRRSVPWWHVIASPVGGWVVFLVGIFVAGNALAPLGFGLWSAALVAWALTAGVVLGARRFVVRGFELLRPGQRPRTHSFVATAAVLLLGGFVSALVNVMMN